MRLIGLSVLLLLLIGCEQPQQTSETESAAAANDPATTAPDGQTHFENACATCHGGALKNAPHRDMIGLMTPESILKTMTTGIMIKKARNLGNSR